MIVLGFRKELECGMYSADALVLYRVAEYIPHFKAMICESPTYINTNSNSVLTAMPISKRNNAKLFFVNT
jgi:hypothetical protein